MQKIWYFLLNQWVGLGLFFTFRKRTGHNKQNIPKHSAVIYVGNHQNGLVDAIQIPTLPTQEVHFITRSDVFKNPLVGRFLRSINMIPIYRLRDGRDKLAKNVEILDYCADLLVNGGKLQLFPEGNHGHQRNVRPFKKGFADIAFMALAKKQDLALKVIPVGINYDTKSGFPATVALYYGEPIDASKYYDPNDLKKSSSELTEAAATAIKKLTTHVVPTEGYDQLIRQLEDEGIDFLDPKAANELIQTRKFVGGKKRTPQFGPLDWLIYALFTGTSILPLLLWWKVKKGIKDPAFVNTFRFVFVLVVFPIFYLLVGWVIAHYWGSRAGLIYLGFVIVLGYLRKRLPYQALGEK